MAKGLYKFEVLDDFKNTTEINKKDRKGSYLGFPHTQATNQIFAKHFSLVIPFFSEKERIYFLQYNLDRRGV
ncbi:MAG TPA: hypothetical protein VJB06_04330 [archaeon]|nr:hypothetical protein [archaeon]